jgi:DNA invertase Pin-like site-specific DNA recombinase
MEDFPMSRDKNSGLSPDSPLNVLIYCRTSSTELPAEKQAAAYDGEEGFLRGWARLHFCRPINARVVKADWDAASRISALSTMKELVQSGAVRTIVMSSLDRLGRGVDVFEFLEFANKAKARVYAVDDGIDTASTDWRVAAMFAALKREFSTQDDDR